MRKKSSTANPKIVPVLVNKKNEEIAINEIHKKVVNSSALNGGFETLLYKIDKIEQGQGQLVAKVDKIHEAIYDPSDGIFSRLAEHKLESNEKFNEITQGMNELNIWKKRREIEEVKEDLLIDRSVNKLTSLEQSVDSLVKTKESTWSFLKWFGVAVGGGIITLFFSWLETKFR